MLYDFTRLNLFTFPALLAAVLNLFLGILVLLKNRKNSINRSFALWCLIVVIHTTAVVSFYLSRSISIAGFSTHVFSISLVLMPPIFLRFIFNFVSSQNGKRLLPLFYLISILFIPFILFTSYFIEEIYLTGWPFYYKLKGGFLCILYIIYFIFAATTGIVLLINKIKDSSRHSFNQIIYLLLAITIGGSAGTINMILVCFRQPFDTASYVGVSIYGLLVAYSILKHRLMDITVVIRKGLIYSAVVGLFTGFYLAGIFLLGQILQEITGGSYVFLAAITIILVALGFQPLRNRIQNYVDHIFFKGKYDYQKTLKDLSAASAARIDLEELLEQVVKTVTATMKAENCSVYVLEDEKRFILKEQS